MKPKKCANPSCRKQFIPDKGFQSWCCVDCAIVIANIKRDKKAKAEKRAFKKETVARKKELKKNDRREWIKKATTVCNAYIRLRDEAMPCISCGRHHIGQYHAGHYRPAGNNSLLRFHEFNIFKQCAPCNTHLSGNLTHYRISLIGRLGLEMVEWLERQTETKQWTIDELKEVVDYYKNKTSELKQLGR